ncbi:MAG: Hsp33 family molecular chaperone HslO [Steroidobacteraceae bacterium]
MPPDVVRRFILEGEPVRGHFVRVQDAWGALREHRDYPAPVRNLLGEAVSASVLLAAAVKFRGTLSVQLSGNGAVPLLVSQCTDDFRVRALARMDGGRLSQAPPAGDAGMFRQLVGTESRLAVTVESAERDVGYQGIVRLAGGSLAECLEEYFASSEQVPTRVRLAADEHHAAGLLVQRLPGKPASPQDIEALSGPQNAGVLSAWRDAEEGIGGIARRELLQAPLDDLLARHFGRRDLRLFSGSPVRFECRCDAARVTQVLRSLGAAEVRDVLAEQGSVTVTCDFCSRPYRFDAVDVEQLLAAGATAEAPRSVQ